METDELNNFSSTIFTFSVEYENKTQNVMSVIFFNLPMKNFESWTSIEYNVTFL